MKKYRYALYILPLALFLTIFITGPVRAGEVHELARKGKVKELSALLEKTPELLNLGDESGATPLHWAAIEGQLVVVEFLISQGADVNATKNGGSTPLHWAKNAETAEVLIQYGADINALNQYKGTPLHWGVHSLQNDKVKLLVEKGADVNARDDRGRNPLHWAAMFRNLEAAEILISKITDINLKDREGHTALKIAKDKGYNEIVELLKKNGGKE